MAGMEKNEDPSKHLTNQIRKARKLTNRPFGINIPPDLAQTGILIDVVLREAVGIVITAAGDPAFFTELLRHNGITVIHVVSSVKQAQTAQSAQADAVIVEGVEAAGHIGFDELPLFSLIPQVADAVSTPVIAAGGIADARGVVAQHRELIDKLI